MDLSPMTNTTTTSRLLGLLLAGALAALAGACNGLDPTTPGADPAVQLLGSPDLPGVATDPAGPYFTPAAAPGVPLWRQYRLDSAPWEVLLRYPPDVQATILERWERKRLLRDNTPSKVFLNFNGQTITVTNDDDATTNRSWIPDVSGSTVTIPAFNSAPWGSRDSIINYIVTGLQTLYAGYNVTFTTTRPSSGDYMMTMIGGSHSTIGMDYGTLGVSALDCYGNELNLNATNINYIFTESLAAFGSGLQDVVNTIAHENGHAYGLSHINRQQDIMYYASSGGTLSWGAASIDGDGCAGSSATYQDDRLFLTRAVGGGSGETTPPTVTIISPANGSTQGSAFDVTISATDTSGVKKVELYVNNVLRNSAVAEPYKFSLLGMAAGSYQLSAKAIDYFDNVGTSPTVTVTVPGSQPTGCTTDDQCGPNQKCQGGTCVDKPPTPTGGSLGANCDRNEDCLSGWCIFGEQNYCTQACNEAQNIYCPVGYNCSPDGFCLSATTIPPGAIGASCSLNDECRSSICVDGANNGYCTAVCQPNGAPCPNDSACVDSGDGQTFICNRPPGPPTADGGTTAVGGGGGCATAPAAPSAGFFGLALLALLGARRRRD